MRIDAINKMNQLYQATKPKKVNQPGSEKTREKYKVSRPGQDYQTAKAAIKASPDIREDRIAGIKDALATGTYNVSAQEIADKMVSKYFDSIL
ncbi:MAG TPA: flagellar biosynthesis anti-sigma factor FlgM [Lachnospiraceae bacterium]|nr:flagellar biosynthesis anti-sigma factor FlgM [Lachnospiraceae bacterium]